jgi:hypothetical protein
MTLANSYYWIDPVRQIAGVYATQVLPLFDARAVQTFQTSKPRSTRWPDRLLGYIVTGCWLRCCCDRRRQFASWKRLRDALVLVPQRW